MNMVRAKCRYIYISRRKSRIWFVFFTTLLLIVGCFADKSLQKPIATLVVEYPLDIPENALVTVVWNSPACESYGFYLSINLEGKITTRCDTKRRIIGTTGNLTGSELTKLDNIFKDLQQSTEPSENVGSYAVMVLLQDGSKIGIGCGNRNCPLAVRQLFELAERSLAQDFLPSAWSPFADEVIHIHPLPHYKMRLTWFENLEWYYVLDIREDGLLSMSTRKDYGTFEFQGSMVLTGSQADQLNGCLRSLPSLPETISGDDLTVVKVSYLLDEQAMLLRFDKNTPPECLNDVLMLGRSVLHQ